MAFNGPGPGRPKGAPNTKTQLGREAIAKFVDDNASRLVGWLDQIAADNPKAAFDSYMAVVEYHIPKLARTEVTGKDGDDIKVSLQDRRMAAELEAQEIMLRLKNRMAENV